MLEMNDNTNYALHLYYSILENHENEQALMDSSMEEEKIIEEETSVNSKLQSYSSLSIKDQNATITNNLNKNNENDLNNSARTSDYRPHSNWFQKARPSF